MSAPAIVPRTSNSNSIVRVPSYIAARAALLHSKRERGEALNFFLHTSADQLDAVNQSWPSSNWGEGIIPPDYVMAVSWPFPMDGLVVMVGGKNQNEEIRKQNFSAPG